MLNYLSAENITCSIAERVLLSEIFVGVQKGDRIALVGRNGCGKSTFLKILASEINPDSGSVSLRNGITIGYLGQQTVLDETSTVFENIFTENHQKYQLLSLYESKLQATKLGTASEHELHHLHELMDFHRVWQFEQEIKITISNMGISDLVNMPVHSLSGGQKKKVSIARILLLKPDIILLDEPTNHLDLETIEWLEKLLKQDFDTLILVSHDRYFIDNVCNQIWEIADKNLYKYKGNYAYYLEKRAERFLIEHAEIDKARNLMRKELEWIRRQPKARGTKAKYRVEAFDELKSVASQKKHEANISLTIKENRLGSKILEVRNISKSFHGKTIIQAFSYTFKRFDRVGIVGNNGSGKTTFLNIIAGVETPDKGEVVHGDTLTIGYYQQEQTELALSKRVIETVKDLADVIELKNGNKITASQLLTRFLFPPAEQYKWVSQLSGGERKRLQLLVVLLKNPNFLILDEPTNDLDIETLNVLEDFLEEFRGVLVLVSHDRYFMDKLVDHLLVFDGNGQIKDFPGNYSDYRQFMDAKDPSPTSSSVESAKPSAEKTRNKTKLSYKDQRELDELEKKIPAMEQQIQALIERMQQITDHQELNKIGKEIEELSEEIERSMLRWMELSEN